MISRTIMALATVADLGYGSAALLRPEPDMTALCISAVGFACAGVFVLNAVVSGPAPQPVPLSAQRPRR